MPSYARKNFPQSLDFRTNRSIIIHMIMGRPKNFDETRALEAAMTQFWRDGYHDTSLQSLLKATGLSKSSLYQTFGCKQDLFIRCFEHYQRTMVNDLTNVLNKASSPRQFIQDFLHSIIAEATPDNHQRKGCLIVKSAHELSQKDPLIASAVSASTDRIAAIFTRAIELGKTSGDISSRTPTDTLVGYLMTNICGLRTMVMAGVDGRTLEPIIELMMEVIE